MICPDALIIAVHTTGITQEDAQGLSVTADLITACASKLVREITGKNALLQAGTAIPVSAMTKRGKDLILDKLKATDEQVFIKGTPAAVYRRYPAVTAGIIPLIRPLRKFYQVQLYGVFPFFDLIFPICKTEKCPVKW